MKVILIKDCEAGKKGATVNVSDGYATNFLIPKGFAIKSTNEAQQELAVENANERQRQKELMQAALKDKQRIETVNVEFTAKVGANGMMFGTISTKQIADGMKKQWGIDIDKRKFIDKIPVNALGYTKLRNELYKGSAGEVIATVNVHVSEEK